MIERGPFARDRMTLLAYGMAGMFGYAIGVLGPSMPLLRDELGMSRTLGGAHFTLVAAGALAVGLFAERLNRRFGRRMVLWVGGAGAACGVGLVGIASHPALSLLGAMMIGGPGSAMLTAVQSSLSDRHQRHRAVALTEGNLATSVGTVFPALLIGGLEATLLGWRAAMTVPVLLVIALFLAGAAEPLPPASPAPDAVPGRRRRERPLGRPFWLLWAAVVPAVASEWCIGAWGAGYLVDVGGATEGRAALLMVAFFGAMAVGRYGGSRLARRIDPAPIVLGSTAIALAGVLLFWASGEIGAITAGLFVAGVGIANLFPMILTMAFERSPGRADLASARIMAAGGAAVVTAPLTLGAVADRVGIRPSFGLVPALLLALVVLVGAASRRR
jgi:predicted MFS family arabinose efflux permease